MEKILLAINHVKTEEAIKTMLKGSFLCVGTATYKEAIIPSLKDMKVDILLMRDTLEGSTPIMDIVEEIRIESPATRIIFISKYRDKSDPLLASLVSYGIYDIINKDSVYVDEMISYIKTPRTFRDVALYYNGAKYVEHEEEPEETPQKQGILGMLFGNKSSKTQNSSHSTQFQCSESALPQPDIESLRTVIREEERKKAQQDIDNLIQDEIKQATEKIKENEIEKDREIATLKADLLKKSKQADQDRMDVNNKQIQLEQLEREFKLLQNARKKEQEEHSRQIASFAKVEDPKWFKNQMVEKTNTITTLEDTLHKRELELQELTQKYDSLKQTYEQETEHQSSQALDQDEELKKVNSQLNQKTEELEALKLQVQKMKETGSYDEANMQDGLELDLDPEYKDPPNGQAHSIIMLGAKHGVGNTTITLNTAVAMAKKGYKVLVMEFNSHFPMLNHFFEFVNITNGIDTACDGILSNNTKAVDKAIIQPHQMKPKRRELRSSYKRLPTGLHFMLYSNGFLTSDNQVIEERAIKDMFYYLTVQLQYAYIFVDLQPDDEKMKDIFLKSGFLADRMLLTMTQDTHSIVSAGYMLEHLAKGRSANLVQSSTVILNRYQHSAAMKKAEIQKWMKIPNGKMLCMTDDPVVYFDSGSYGIPYACSKANYVSEYDQIVNAILNGNSKNAGL